MSDFSHPEQKKRKPHYFIWARLIISNGTLESPGETLSFIQTELHRAHSKELLVFKQLVCRITCPSDQECFRGLSIELDMRVFV